MSDIIQAIGLIDEDFIAVYPTAAKYLGINKAVMIQELHRHLNNTRKTENKRGDKAFHFIDGEWWIYNSLTDWQEDHFPWLSEDSIGRLFGELEDDGLIKSRFVKGKGINAKWYTVDYPAWNQFVLSTGKTPDFRQNAESTSGKMPIVSEAISAQAENTTESKEEKKKISAPKKTGADKPATAKKPRNIKTTIPAAQMNPMKDAIAAAFKWSWETMTGAEKGKIQRAAKQLCEAGRTPGDVPVIFRYCEKKFDNFTPLALPAHATEALKIRPKPAPMPENVIPYTFTPSADPEETRARFFESVSS